MRLLSLIRHAKSSWKEPGVADFDRRLNKRGLRDAPRMAARFARLEPRPDLFVSSPARRALETATAFCDALQVREQDLRLEGDVYEASAARLLEIVRGFESRFEHVALCGHNPGLTDLAERLAGVEIGNLPTCGIVQIEFPIDRWQDADLGLGNLRRLDYPKKDAG